MLNIYVDGSARNNGKKNKISTGGYGIIIFDDENNLIDAYCEYYNNITNNQMELKALLKTFEMIYNSSIIEKINIYSDSAYCVNILTSWINSWASNNWRNKKGELIQNLELIISLYNYYITNFLNCQVNIIKIKGHNNNIGNELADALATKNKKKFEEIILNNHINIKMTNLFEK